jgi:hypothetical protein
MFNMGRQFVDKSNIWILAATIFVECLPLPSFSAPADDLYQRLKKSPTQDRSELERAQLETTDQARIQKMNEEAELNRRKNELADRQLPPLPTLSAEPDETRANGSNPLAPALSGSSESRAPTQTSRSTEISPTSAANPTVTYDPLPDEIEFPGESNPAKKPSKSPQKK